MTNFQVIYDAFLSKILEDEWALWDEEDMKNDWKSLLKSALPNFKFPRVSLDIEINSESGEEVFSGDLNNEEIQILATYMKCEWLNRTILTWENVKPLYEERDFSQANLIDKFRLTLEEERKNAEKQEAKYYRSIRRRPFDYTRLATQVKDV